MLSISLLEALLILFEVVAAGTAPVVAVAGTSGLAVDAPVADASVEVAPGSVCDDARVLFAPPAPGFV
jgi:hypothetical protein